MLSSFFNFEIDIWYSSEDLGHVPIIKSSYNKIQNTKEKEKENARVDINRIAKR